VRVSIDGEDQPNALADNADEPFVKPRRVWWLVVAAGVATFGVAPLDQANAVAQAERCLGNFDAGDRLGCLFAFVVVDPLVGVFGALTALAAVVLARRWRWPATVFCVTLTVVAYSFAVSLFLSRVYYRSGAICA
jgi:hypothetical protein